MAPLEPARRRPPLVAVALVLGALLWMAGPAMARRIGGFPGHAPLPGAARALAVNPFPGTPDAAPSTEIVFSALRPPALRAVTVRGSRTGIHRGRLSALPGGAGTAFLPIHPFRSGEQVTVRASLSSPAAGTASGDPGSTQLRFSFGVAAPLAEPPVRAARVRRAPRGPGVWQIYRSEPTLHPPVVRFDKRADPRAGDVFLSPVRAAQMGALIMSPRGQLVWFKHTGRPTPFNFQEQRYRGHPVLTWWQGNVRDGRGVNGQDVIMDSHYRTVAVLHGGHGYSSDLHEFQLIPHGRALIDAFVPVDTDLSSVGGPASAPVFDCVIQELDVRTGRVLWEWHSLGHVPLSASEYWLPGNSTPFDYFHLNSIQQLPGGKLIISARNTWSVYMIDERTGRVMWTLGGKYSSYRMGPGTNFEWQHDARMHRHGLLSLFDDGALPEEEPESSAKELRVNPRTGTVSLVRRFTHVPSLLAGSQGNAQVLDHGHVMVGWGSAAAFSEYTPGGHEVLDGHLRFGSSSYRTYRFPWTGQPLTHPSLAAVPLTDGTVRLYASWNGATQVASWEVLGGSERHDLFPLSAHSTTGFQTTMRARDELPFFAVEALNSGGKILHESFVQPVAPHVAIFTRRAFVSTSTGQTQVPVGCFAPGACRLTVTLRAGRTVIGSQRATVAPWSSALVSPTLSQAAVRRLVGAPRQEMTVRVGARQHSGPGGSRQITLAGYSTSGPRPTMSVTDSPTIALVGTSEYVSSSGRGGILAVCHGPVPCEVGATIRVGHAVVARPGAQRLGANEVGFLGFRLSAVGQWILSHTPGNQLAARVRLTSGQSVARGQVVLSLYG